MTRTIKLINIGSLSILKSFGVIIGDNSNALANTLRFLWPASSNLFLEEKTDIMKFKPTYKPGLTIRNIRRMSQERWYPLLNDRLLQRIYTDSTNSIMNQPKIVLQSGTPQRFEETRSPRREDLAGRTCCLPTVINRNYTTYTDALSTSLLLVLSNLSCILRFLLPFYGPKRTVENCETLLFQYFFGKQLRATVMRTLIASHIMWIWEYYYSSCHVNLITLPRVFHPSRKSRNSAVDWTCYYSWQLASLP